MIKKSTLQTLIIVLITLFRAMMYAQSPITSAIEPIVGDIHVYDYSNSFIEPGSSGPGQTWNLTLFISGNMFTRSCVGVEGTPFQKDFPDADYSIKVSAPLTPTIYEYFSAQNEDVSFYGIGQLGSILINYAPYWLRDYPLAYDSTYKQSFSSTRKVGNQITYSKFELTQKYDAYGSINLLSKLYKNGVRLKTTITRTDSLSTGNGSYVQTLSNQEWYNYYDLDTRGYLAFSFRKNDKQTTFSKTGEVISVTTFPRVEQTEIRIDTKTSNAPDVGFASESKMFDLLENPVNAHLSLKFSEHVYSDGPVLMDILSIDGRPIIQSNIAVTDDAPYILNVSNLPAGTYWVRTTQGARRTSKIWIKM